MLLSGSYRAKLSLASRFGLEFSRPSLLNPCLRICLVAHFPTFLLAYLLSCLHGCSLKSSTNLNLSSSSSQSALSLDYDKYSHNPKENLEAHLHWGLFLRIFDSAIWTSFSGSMLSQYMLRALRYVTSNKKVCVRLLGSIFGASPPVCPFVW